MESLLAFLLGVLVAAVLYGVYDFIRARSAERDAWEKEARARAVEAIHTAILTADAHRIMEIAKGEASDDAKLQAVIALLSEKGEDGHPRFFAPARARIEGMIRERGDQAALALVLEAERVMNPGSLESVATRAAS